MIGQLSLKHGWLNNWLFRVIALFFLVWWLQEDGIRPSCMHTRRHAVVLIVVVVCGGMLSTHGLDINTVLPDGCSFSLQKRIWMAQEELYGATRMLHTLWPYNNLYMFCIPVGKISVRYFEPYFGLHPLIKTPSKSLYFIFSPSSVLSCFGCAASIFGRRLLWRRWDHCYCDVTLRSAAKMTSSI